MSPTFIDFARADFDTIATPAKRIIVWDSAQKGLGLRISPKRAMTYIVKVRLGRGRFAAQRFVSLGPLGQLTIKNVRAEAQAVLARALTKSQPEPRPIVEFNDALTIAKLCDMWLEKAAHRRRGRGPLAGSLRKEAHVRNDKGRIEAHIKPLLGKARVRELNRSMIESYRDAVSRGDTRLTKKGQRKRAKHIIRGGEGTANRSLALLSTIMSFAVREEIIDRNPVFGIERSPGNMRERFLSQEEFARLGEVIARAEKEGAHPFGLAIIRLLALSGARKSEIQNLTWSSVDLNTGFLRLPRSKTGPRIILITSAMRAILEKIKRVDGTDFVFPNADKTAPFNGVPKMWVGIREAAGLHDVRLHDLRHSAASFALMSGVGLEVIGKLLGHSDLKTTRRYAHLADVVVRAAAEHTADQIADLMAARASEPPVPVPPSPSTPHATEPRGMRFGPAPGARRAPARPDGRRPARA
ncbi:tyrosine-type recombinase/integrase [Vitreimonas flagellata]|jgi:integrase|uniref:tyrosine-type recombinase/integrase n=1 Tax=Vitreimonas flagellata TaxID=2560861 RepID=UPI001074F9AE|nr:tyrosine-type recombinase/integrase [Vitreimonas flagellata]